MTPFSHPAHRTGQADLPHPALGQDFTPLLSRATPSVVSEHSAEFIGCPISRSFTTYFVCLELRSLPSTGITRLQRYHEPLRHPKAPGLRLVVADRALGLPVFRALSLCTCCRHYPGAASGRITSLISSRRSSLPREGCRVGLRIVLFEACSAALWRGQLRECWKEMDHICFLFCETRLVSQIFMCVPAAAPSCGRSRVIAACFVPTARYPVRQCKRGPNVVATSMKIITIRQPWAQLIVNGSKNIENRNWATSYRGPVLIHASLNVNRALCLKHRLDPDTLLRGGVVGIAEIADCVNEHSSRWFLGP